MNLLSETWRPKVREDLVGNKQTIDAIFSMVNSGKLQHMIFESPTPGVGKTSTALVIARQLFGDYVKTNFKEMNASDERKIEDVRTTITTFAKTIPFGTSFKILLLDEADSMTPDAQNALRRIMEKYSDSCIFIFTVNNIEKIIEPIRSRCQVFHFGPLSVEDITQRLSHVFAKEKKENSATALVALRKIAEYSQGDMRKALNHLQVLLASGEPLSEASVNAFKPVDYGKLIVDSISFGRFLEARNHYFKALELGYEPRHIVSLIHKVYIASDVDIEKMKNAILSLAECDYRMTLGVDKILALDALLLRLMK